MAKAWIQDLWVKDHILRDSSGTIVQRQKPTSRQLQAIGRLPQEYRSANYGKGARWRVNWLEEHEGKPQRKAEAFTTKTLAEQRVSELNTTLNAGTHVTKNLRKQRVEDVAEMWLRSKQKIRASTHKRYRDELDRYVLPKWGERSIDSITQEQVEEWVSQLRNGVAPHFFEVERQQAKLEASAVKHIVRIVFGAVMRYALNKGWLTKSPVAGVELPDAAERDVDSQVLSPIELEALIEAGDNVSAQDGRIVRVLAFTGIRIGELIALRVRDWDGSTLTVRETVSQTSSGLRMGPTKSGKVRTIPVAPIAAAALDEQVENHKSDAPIFRNSDGGHLHPNNWRARSWKHIAAGSGLDIDVLTPHSLRHTAASMAISAGANILIVSRMLGHKSTTITLSTYAHLYPSDFDAIGELMQSHYERGLVRE